jgi:phage terminase large subunit-like protein
MRHLAGAMLALALTGCQARQSAHDATLAVAQDAAEDAAEPVKEQVKALESRLEELEAELHQEEAYSKAIHAALNEERENRKREVAELRDHYNDHLRRFHGEP